jgi:hypothetical protein
MTTSLWVLLTLAVGAGAIALTVLHIMALIWQASEQDDRPWEDSALDQHASRPGVTLAKTNKCAQAAGSSDSSPAM